MQIIRCNNEVKNLNQASTARDICSRHILVFGEETQRNISESIVGVNSTGGLGFLLLELLMRLFPRKLIFIDKDRVEMSNLNRLTGATPIDARLNTRKVDVASRNILNFNSDQQISAIQGDFLIEANQSKFKECDVIFGATDSNAVRIATNRLCLAHGIPYLDCGSGAVVHDGILTAAGGQVIIILPGSDFCLHCSGMFNVQNTMQEFISDEERNRRADQGYIRGTEIPAPQVYSLNMMVASQAVWLFTRMLCGEKLEFDGISINAKDFQSQPWNEPSKKVNECPTCGTGGIVFQADDVDLLCRESRESEIDDFTLVHPVTKSEINEGIEILDREIPISSFPKLVLGRDESSSSDLGYWFR